MTTSMSLEEEDNNSEESSSANESNVLLDSSNNAIFQWTINEPVMMPSSENDEKIYEDLCYVTFSSPSEVFINQILITVDCIVCCWQILLFERLLPGIEAEIFF